ncbi:MAG: hypothetical protein DRR19_02595 [Candidatus Parabeggiatoa sp. nov. 1]|nr:MAG: hypothetical protein DRR19_02595 [Gammaproteobacteria bacterium]
MQNLTLRSRVGADGNLHLDIPTTLTNTDLDVIVWLRPINVSDNDERQETFVEWWTKQLANMPSSENHAERDRARYALHS